MDAKTDKFFLGPGLEIVQGWESRLGCVTLKELLVDRSSSVSYC